MSSGPGIDNIVSKPINHMYNRDNQDNVEKEKSIQTAHRQTYSELMKDLPPWYGQ